jgi:hypothetical protein
VARRSCIRASSIIPLRFPHLPRCPISPLPRSCRWGHPPSRHIYPRHWICRFLASLPAPFRSRDEQRNAPRTNLKWTSSAPSSRSVQRTRRRKTTRLQCANTEVSMSAARTRQRNDVGTALALRTAAVSKSCRRQQKRRRSTVDRLLRAPLRPTMPTILAVFIPLISLTFLPPHLLLRSSVFSSIRVLVCLKPRRSLLPLAGSSPSPTHRLMWRTLFCGERRRAGREWMMKLLPKLCGNWTASAVKVPVRGRVWPASLVRPAVAQEPRLKALHSGKGLVLWSQAGEPAPRPNTVPSRRSGHSLGWVWRQRERSKAATS